MQWHDVNERTPETTRGSSWSWVPISICQWESPVSVKKNHPKCEWCLEISLVPEWCQHPTVAGGNIIIHWILVTVLERLLPLSSGKKIALDYMLPWRHLTKLNYDLKDRTVSWQYIKHHQAWKIQKWWPITWRKVNQRKLTQKRDRW